MRYSFVGTKSDLLDAFDADVQRRTGMRPWIRYALVGIGIFWLVGFLLVFVEGLGSVKWWWQPVLWLILGLGVTWYFGVRPILVRRAIARDPIPDERLDIQFYDSGALVRFRETEELLRPWEEFSGLYTHKKGLLLYMSDGAAHWLPIRVFKSNQEMIALSEYVRTSCEALSQDPNS